MTTNGAMPGLELKVARVRARVAGWRVAKAMGVSRQRVSQIEGTETVSADVAARYLAALNEAARPWLGEKVE